MSGSLRLRGALVPGALLTVLAAVAGAQVPATAQDTTGGGGRAQISYAEPRGDGVDLLVSVPAGTTLDLDGVGVDIAGTDVAAEASPAGDAASGGGLARTAVLAVDVSDSMAGERFAAAQDAARTFLDSAPDDVAVGVVTFAGDVAVALEPTTDRSAATEVVDGLDLSRGTLLHEGVSTAVELAGADGQRSVLVLSDGADTSGTPVEPVVGLVEEAGVMVDVVSLERDDAGAAALRVVAGAGGGRVVEADADALAETFGAEADVLARQVQVRAEVPDDVTATRAPVTVTLPTARGGDPVVARSFVPVRDAAVPAEPATALPVVADAGALFGLQVPTWTLLPAVGVLGVGLLGMLVLLVPAGPVAPTPGERLERYVRTTGRGARHAADAPSDPVRKQAGDVAAKVLGRSVSLEGRIARRLEAAGSPMRPAEWLLVHVGVAVGLSLVGSLLGGLVLGVLLLLVGAVVPWLYLSFRRRRRRRAFDAALPDTLQLISGSLAAGLSLAQSIDTIVREGAEVVATEFKRVLVETRLGVPLEEALDGVASRYESKDFGWVVMAIRIQRQVGGNLAELLDTVAATMREREYVRRQVSALAAEGKLSAIVLAVLPPGFMAYLFVAQRDYVMILFTDPRGLIIVIGSAVWLAIGIFWMSKLAKVEV